MSNIVLSLKYDFVLYLFQQSIQSGQLTYNQNSLHNIFKDFKMLLYHLIAFMLNNSICHCQVQI